MGASEQFNRPCSAFTQQLLSRGKQKNRSVEMQLVKKRRGEGIEGWDVENQEYFDLF